MKILFYFGHPAQYYFLRTTIFNLIKNKHSVILIIKSKDVLENIIASDDLPYKNILSSERGKSKFSIAFSFLKRLVSLFPIVIKEKPKLLIGTDATIAILGKIFNIHRITITEDDYDVIKKLANLTYPYTETILCPTVCDVGKFKEKKIGYEGYMKLGYLHPNVFKQDDQIIGNYNINSSFVLIRLARLSAHHDFGIKGISPKILNKIIKICETNGYKVFISSESNIDTKFNSYLLKINPVDMHQILSFASLFISDSQSMSVEASMVGTPSIRFSGFAGKISVLEELEHKYKLTFCIKPSEENKLFNKINELLKDKKIKNTFKEKRNIMLKDKIDVTAFLTWFVEYYPKSKRIMKENPDYQYKFK